jgi:hypothetical protein
VSNKEVQFYPFHAINDFMRSDFRSEVIKQTLYGILDLTEDYRTVVDRYTKRFVQVPGFRNSAKAPVNLRLKPTGEVFEKNPGLVAAIIHAWTELHADLRQRVFDLLISRNWDILPPEANRTKLPGFLIHWPKDEDFEKLFMAYQDMYPDFLDSSDDVSLMVVWVSNRLPYQLEDEAGHE